MFPVFVFYYRMNSSLGNTKNFCDFPLTESGVPGKYSYFSHFVLGELTEVRVDTFLCHLKTYAKRMLHVFRLGHALKIINLIVKLVSVHMVYLKTFLDRTFKRFVYESVHKEVLRSGAIVKPFSVVPPVKPLLKRLPGAARHFPGIRYIVFREPFYGFKYFYHGHSIGIFRRKSI